jgi:8-oxo-dGTP pyrophosphatase MutT (NUDIX family)
MNVWTSILPITREGKWVLQHRDDRPDIVEPGKISFFGGHSDDGETPLACAIREAREELGLVLRSDDLEFVRVFPIEEDGVLKGNIHFYLVRNVDPRSLVLGEGQGFVFLNPEANLDRPDVSTICREILGEFRRVPMNRLP